MRSFATQLHAALSREIDNGFRTGTPHIGFRWEYLAAIFNTPSGNYTVTDHFARFSSAYLAQRNNGEYGKVWKSVRTGRAILSVLSEEMEAAGEGSITLYRPEDVAYVNLDNRPPILSTFARLGGAEPTPGEVVAVLTPETLPRQLQEISATDNKHLRALAACVGVKVEA